MSSVFLSHHTNDKEFVGKLKVCLARDGINVWGNEDEMLEGDFLINKISYGIASIEYLGVIISKSSNKSFWLQKDAAFVAAKEINGKRVVVLPILLEGYEIPVFLKDKPYADFTNGFDIGYQGLLKTLTKPKGFTADPGGQEFAVSDTLEKKEIAKIKCKGKTSRGKACKEEVVEGSQYCLTHLPSDQKAKSRQTLKRHNYFKELFPLILFLLISVPLVAGYIHKQNEYRKNIYIEIQRNVSWLKACRDLVNDFKRKLNYSNNSFPDLDSFPQHSEVYAWYKSELHLLPSNLMPVVKDFFDALEKTEEARQGCYVQLRSKQMDVAQRCVDYEKLRDDAIKMGDLLLQRGEF